MELSYLSFLAYHHDAFTTPRIRVAPFDKFTMPPPSAAKPANDAELISTRDAARMLGLAVRSVQLMVDRGELVAWKTPGGHRRIEQQSVRRWLQARQQGSASMATAPWQRPRPTVLLIEDSRHCQNLIRLLVAEHEPDVELVVADDSLAGLALVGRWQPAVILVDILLPGIDGATLIRSLRSQQPFLHSRCIVVTGLQGAELAPYRAALRGVPIVHKQHLVTQLPPRLREALQAASAPAPPGRPTAGLSA